LIELEAYKSEYETRIEQLQVLHDEMENSLMAQNAELRTKVQQLEASIPPALPIVDAAPVHQLREEMAEKDNVIAGLQAQLSKASSPNSQTADIEVYHRQTSELNGRLDESERYVSELKSLLNTAQSEKHDLAEQLRTASEGVHEKQSALESKHAEEVSALKASVEEIQSKLEKKVPHLLIVFYPFF